MKIKFIVSQPKEYDTNAGGAEATIDIDDNFGDAVNVVPEWKQFLSELYDCDVKHIYTQEEWDKERQFENEMMEEEWRHEEND